MTEYKTLYYDWDEDCLVDTMNLLNQRFRNYAHGVKYTLVVGEKEPYNVICYYKLEGDIPPAPAHVGVKILKHVKRLES